MPNEASLALARPKGFFAELSDEEFAAKVRDAIRERESAIREKFKREGREFLGREGVLAQSPRGFPRPSEERFKLNPRVAAIDKWKRIELLQLLEEFVVNHAVALKEWAGGNREVVFPFGTYLMKVLHRARCAPAPA